MFRVIGEAQRYEHSILERRNRNTRNTGNTRDTGNTKEYEEHDEHRGFGECYWLLGPRRLILSTSVFLVFLVFPVFLPSASII